MEVTALQNLENGDAQGIVNFYDRVISDIISESIAGSIINTLIKKLRINQKEY